MNKRLKFLSFWSINDSLELDRLTLQLNELKAAGLDGVIFHPRYYPNDPYYMNKTYLEIVSDLILYAKEIGMEFWLYDENGWPSGTAGGEVMAKRPELKCEWLEAVPLSNGQFELVIGSKPGVSSFQSDATALFIEITHEGYRRGLKPEAFEYVTGFFSDEVGFLDGHGVTVNKGAVPWDERFPAMYESKYGDSLQPLLPLLFTDGEGHEQVRIRFWELLTDALVDGFYKPIKAWCQAHGKRYTAHLKAEEHPYFQLSYSGSCFQVLKEIETPAIDALERYSGNNFYPRLLHSIAVQQGRDGCLVEAMGGSGWGVSPESFTDYIMWLAGHGIDQYVLHLNQFRLNTQAIQDWPPSMPCHLTWQEAFPSLLQSVRQKATGLPDLSAEPDVLIVVPTRGIMAAFTPQEARQMNEHDGSNVPDSPSGRLNRQLLQFVEECHEAGIHYELSEERTVEEEGRLLPGMLRIGERNYRKILLADGCRWNDGDMAAKFEAAGIQVFDTTVGGASFRTADSAASADPGEPNLRIEGEIPEQSAWSAMMPESNQAFIPFLQDADGGLRAEFRLEGVSSMTDLTILLHDAVEELWVNKERLHVQKTNNGHVAHIPDSCIDGHEGIHIQARPRLNGEPIPVAFLIGRFSVISLSSFLDKRGEQWMTEGPFKLVPMKQPESSDLISSGFPFAGAPVRVIKELGVAQRDGKSRLLRLTGIQAAAARVRLGEVDLGWCWGPDWTVATGSLTEGRRKLEVELYPSTYNVYGPHCHIDGDRSLTSPGQYQGVKNFADRIDAPELTKGKHWNFVKWGIQGEVRLLEAEG
jgi:hypothetical protein